METSTQTVKYCVLVAMLSAAMAVLLNLQSGDMFSVFIAFGYGTLAYVGVYAKLTTDTAAASTTAGVLALLAGLLLAFALIVSHSPAFTVINCVAAGTMVYAALHLKELAKKTS